MRVEKLRRDKKDTVERKQWRPKRQIRRDRDAEIYSIDEDEEEDDDMSAGSKLLAISDTSLAALTADSIPAFSSGVASDFPVMEEVDFLELPVLFSGAMASVALVPLAAEPPVGRPSEAACMGSLSTPDPLVVLTGTPLKLSVRAFDAYGRVGFYSDATKVRCLPWGKGSLVRDQACGGLVVPRRLTLFAVITLYFLHFFPAFPHSM